jgi:DNA-binding NtrC family response regulator
MAAPLVLVVDDDPDIVDSLKALIESRLGLAVLTATSGHGAMALLESLRPDDIDLVVADYRMAPMDGLEFLMRAKASHPEVPRVLITAYADLDLAVQAINKAGVARLFPKPLQSAQVLRLVRDLTLRRVEVKQRRQALDRAAEEAGRTPVRWTKPPA